MRTCSETKANLCKFNFGPQSEFYEDAVQLGLPKITRVSPYSG